MPLSRTSRVDRRRRVMLDAVSMDSEYAVDTVRAKKRARHQNKEEDSDSISAYRDPGYSQAVRKTCQQRMVQLIPVRRGTLAVVLTCMWLLWGSLIFAHYWLHVRPWNLVAQNSATQSNSANALTTSANNAPAANSQRVAGWHNLPIAQLFHLRSSHSIAHWLTCQLWMFTALSAWMIFQLRRHKLDDYRAKYRIWIALGLAAVFSSFDASSAGLLLLGQSIDGWARREIGYGGWPLVLASFASIIGVLGIRLCSELKSAPTSVASWLVGLFAWAVSALLGTGLLKIQWSPATIDLVVGGCWLGGILAVFQASGIYLRQTYIHAQKRFLERNGANLGPVQWKIPKIRLPRRRRGEDPDRVEEETQSKRRWRVRMPWSQRDGDERDEEDFETTTKPNTAARKDRNRSSEDNADVARSKPTPDSRESKDSDKPRGRLFGFIPHRNEMNEKLASKDEPIHEDDGPAQDLGLTKKRGWFGIGGNRDAEGQGDASSTPRSKVAVQRSSSDGDKEETNAPSKSRLWSKLRRERKPANTSKDEDASENSTKSKRKWIPEFNRSRSNKKAEPTPKSQSQSSQSDSKDNVQVSSGKRSWSTFISRKPKAPKPPAAEKPKPKPSNSEDKKPARKSIFGMFDGLKLKPPADDTTTSTAVSKAPPQPTPKPVSVRPGQSLPSTRPSEEDEEDDGQYSGRPMSKAERKKMRRMQQDDRRAA